MLRAAGKNPTRASVLAQTRKLNDPSNPFLLPGVKVETSPTDRFPIEQAHAAALVEGALDELRRALDVPSGIGSGHA